MEQVSLVCSEPNESKGTIFLLETYEGRFQQMWPTLKKSCTVRTTTKLGRESSKSRQKLLEILNVSVNVFGLS